MHGFLRGGYLSEVANHSQRIFTLILKNNFGGFSYIYDILYVRELVTHFI